MAEQPNQRHRMRRTLKAALAIVLINCGGTATTPQQLTPASPNNVAPSDQTIVAEEDSSFEGQVLSILNNSSAAVVVTSVHIYDCDNVASSCTITRLRTPIGPGQRRRVAVIRPADPERGYSYKYRWTWTVGNK